MRQASILCAALAASGGAALLALAACNAGDAAHPGHERDASASASLDDASVVACTSAGDGGRLCVHPDGGYSAPAEPPSFANLGPDGGDASSDAQGDAGVMMRLRGTIFESDGKTIIPFAVLAIEKGGLYVANADASASNPAYLYGGRADSNGQFDLTLPYDSLGIHTFMSNFEYGRMGLEMVDGGLDRVVTITMAAIGARAKPTITGARAEPSTVAAGEIFFVRASVAAACAADPLSEEILLIEPKTQFSTELDPPCGGRQGKGYPDGEYARAVRAPKSPGTYTYYLTATTEQQCVTGDVVPIVVTVN